DIGANLFQAAQLGFVFQYSVAAFHGHQDAVGAALYRQVEVADQLGHFVVYLNQCIGELYRVRSGEANAVDTLNRRYIGNQFGQVHDCAVFASTAISVHVLSQQVDFTHALTRQVYDLGHHIGHRTADFFTTGVGNHAESAVLGAAFHDGDKGTDAVGVGLGQAIKFFNLRKADVHHHCTIGALGFHHLRQAVQCLGTKDQVHVRRPLSDGSAFLTGDAAADPDNQVGIFLFQLLPATQFVKQLLLSLFTD